LAQNSPIPDYLGPEGPIPDYLAQNMPDSRLLGSRNARFPIISDDQDRFFGQIAFIENWYFWSLCFEVHRLMSSGSIGAFVSLKRDYRQKETGKKNALKKHPQNGESEFCSE
jgi:hypothetical protein